MPHRWLWINDKKICNSYWTYEIRSCYGLPFHIGLLSERSITTVKHHKIGLINPILSEVSSNQIQIITKALDFKYLLSIGHILFPENHLLITKGLLFGEYTKFSVRSENLNILFKTTYYLGIICQLFWKDKVFL